MKKQTNLFRPHAGKLSLNKKTISNLNAAEMNMQVGGGPTKYTTNNTCWSCQGNTCNKPCSRY